MYVGLVRRKKVGVKRAVGGGREGQRDICKGGFALAAAVKVRRAWQKCYCNGAEAGVLEISSS
jgi:hypothetical protein